MKKAKRIILTTLVLIIVLLTLMPNLNSEVEAGAVKQIGDYVEFGSHYNEPLLWKIIHIDSDGAPLLFLEKILEQRAFDESNSNVWETSSLRGWINDTFLQNSFMPGERLMIRETLLTDVNSVDKIFLLSESEVTAYIPKYTERLREFNGTKGKYWLRSPSTSVSQFVRYINLDGYVRDNHASNDDIGFVPALYLHPDYINTSPPTNVPVTEISVTPTEVTLAPGESKQLEVTILPPNATNKAITWSSSDPAIADISDDGIIKALQVGVTTITATTEDGGDTTDITVTVISEYKNWETQYNTPANKIWTIEFSQDVSENAKNFIRVLDSSGNPLNNRVEVAGSVIMVYPPEDNYLFNHTYSIYISKDVSAKHTGLTLDSGIKMDFVIQDTAPVEEGIRITDIYPKEAQMYNVVNLYINKNLSHEGTELLYNGESIPYEIYEDVVSFNSPTESGIIVIEVDGVQSNSVNFTVVTEPKLTLLFEEAISSPNEEQVVGNDDSVKLILPVGSVDGERTVTISKADNVAYNPIIPYTYYSYDVTVEGQSEFNVPVSVEIKYDIELEERMDIVEDMFAQRWDVETNSWIRLPLTVDTDRKLFIIETDHLSVLTVGAAVAAGVSAAYDKLAYHTHKTDNFYFIYPKSILDDKLKNWQTPQYLKNKGVNNDDYITDIGELFEIAYANFIEIHGYPSITRFTRQTVRIETRARSLFVGEASRDWIIGTIFLPDYVFSNYADPNVGAAFEADMLKTIGHELYHSIQSNYFNTREFFRLTSPGDTFWWIEVTAEYAGLRDAWGGPGFKDFDESFPGIKPNIMEFPMTKTGRIRGHNADNEYVMSWYVRFLVDELGIDLKMLMDHIGVYFRNARGGVFGRIEDYISNKNTLCPHAYSDFIAWLLFGNESPFKDMETSDIAKKVEVIPVGEEGLNVDLLNSSGSQVFVYKSSTDDRTLATELGSHKLTDTISIDYGELTAGDKIYILATTNKDSSGNYANIQVSGLTDIHYDFNQPEELTSALWVLEVKVPELLITPDKVEKASVGKEYKFTLRIQDLPEKMTSVEFEWDFGDGKENSKGKSNAITVVDGQAEIEISHTYTDIRNRQTLKASVKEYGESDILDEKEVAIEFYTVVILGDKAYSVNIVRAKDEVANYNVIFTAEASPRDEYTYMWNFGDGSAIETDTQPFGVPSSVTHTYEDIKDGDIFNPYVELINSDGDVVAKNTVRITVIVEDADDNDDNLELFFHDGNTEKYWYYILDPISWNPYANWIKHGKYERYHNGRISWAGYYAHGKRTGTWRFYLWDGSLSEIGNYAEGKKSGTWRTLSGEKLVTIGDYVKDKKSGTWRRYSSNGYLLEIGDYVEGKKSGIWRYYDSIGRYREGNYIEGKKSGTWRSYFSDGTLRETEEIEEYIDGIKQ